MMLLSASILGLRTASPRILPRMAAQRRSPWQPRMAAADASVPTLCVFDLDACLWDKEMFEMPAVPEDPEDAVKGNLNGRGEGTVGVRSGPHRISLHCGALQALQEHADGKHPGMRIACASSADTPFAEQVGRKTLTMLEVLPGVTVWDLLMRDWDGRDVNQIGRQAPLSSNKAETHFPRLREATGVPFDQMLFFDDCNWVRRRHRALLPPAAALAGARGGTGRLHG